MKEINDWQEIHKKIKEQVDELPLRYGPEKFTYESIVKRGYLTGLRIRAKLKEQAATQGSVQETLL